LQRAVPRSLASLDSWSRGSSALHRFDPRAKLIALLALLVAVATANRSIPRFALAVLLFLVAGFLWARLPVAGALARAAVILPFVAVLAAVLWIGGQGERAWALAAKSYLSALAALLAMATTPLPRLLGGFEKLGAPRFLLEVAQFLYRYLFLLPEEAQRMRQAAAARSMRPGIREGFRAAAGALAVLFARSYARAGAIHHAMLARGFNGRFPEMQTAHFRKADAVFAVVASAVPWGLRLL